MSIVPAIDLRPANTEDPKHLPANIELEQALIGLVLYDNGAFERIDDGFSPDDFFEPFHGRLWALIVKVLRAGHAADPLVLAERFNNDGAFADLGGVRYLADLVDRAPNSANAPDYAREIHDLAVRRRVMEMANDAYRAAVAGELTGAEVVEAAEASLFKMAEAAATRGFETFDVALAEAVAMAAAAFGRDGGLSGISTGLVDLDRRLGGLHASDLIILAARPSMGKTALATNIAFHAAKTYRYEVDPDGSHRTIAGGRVGVFSLEMSKAQLAMRLLAEASGVPSDRIRRGEVTPDEFGRIRDAAVLINEIPLYIDDTGGISIAKLAARARRLKRLYGLDLLVVDYLQLVTASVRRSGEGRVQEVTEITQGLKALAKDLNIPVLALSQLSRQVENREDKKPQLSDLRESGSIEQDADVVTFLYREAYYLGRNEPKPDTPEHFDWSTAMDEARGVAELIIGKQRHGPIGTVRLAFNEALTKFGNLAREGRFDTAAARLPYGDDA